MDHEKFYFSWSIKTCVICANYVVQKSFYGRAKCVRFECTDVFSSNRFSQSSLAAFQSFSLKLPRSNFPLQELQNHRQILDVIDPEDTITLQDLDNDFATTEIDIQFDLGSLKLKL